MSVNRDTRELLPEVAAKLIRLKSAMLELGHPIFLVEGWRSQERQNALHSTGVSPTLNSMHTKRRAVDLAFENSMDPYSNENPWELLGLAGEALGFTWGGRWESYDATHFQFDEE
jgi:hypothetical protein